MTTDKKPLFVHCGDCKHEWAAAFLPLPMSAFARLARSPCPMCGGSKSVLLGRLPKPTTTGDAAAWLTNGDTGVSSETIWSVLTGYPVRRTDRPQDPADFGRCYRLLEIMPTWRPRLSEVSKKYPEWSGMVDAWDELTALYEEELPSGRCPKLHARMQELRR